MAKGHSEDRLNIQRDWPRRRGERLEWPIQCEDSRDHLRMTAEQVAIAYLARICEFKKVKGPVTLVNVETVTVELLHNQGVPRIQARFLESDRVITMSVHIAAIK